MIKSRFNYIGQTGFTILLGFGITIMAASFIIEYRTMEIKDKLYLLYASPFLIAAIIMLWNEILTEINEIEINEDKIRIKNIFSKRKKEINRKDLKGFQDNFWSSRISLIDHNNNRVIKINTSYYKDFKELISSLSLEYLGSESTFFSKLFSTDKKLKTK